MQSIERSLLCAALLGSGVFASFGLDAVHAQASKKRSEAKERLAQANAYFKAGVFDKAALEYEGVYALVPKNALLFNVGLCYENFGDLARAAKAYKRFLAKASAGPKVVEARARLAALERKLKAQDTDRASTALAEDALKRARAYIGSGAVSEAMAEYEKSFQVSGNVELVFEMAQGYASNSRSSLAIIELQRYLQIAPRGQNRQLATQELERLRAESKGTDEAPGLKEAGPSSSSDTNTGSDAARDLGLQSASPKAMRSERPSLIPAIAFLSIGGVALGGGLYFNGRAASIDDELATQLETGNPPLDTGDSRYEEGRRQVLSANISYGVAGLSLALGGWFLYRSLSHDDEDESAISVGPIVGPDHSGLRVGGRF